jgi:hypothetical protein
MSAAGYYASQFVPPSAPASLRSDAPVEARRGAKTLGAAATLFFLAKGLLWLLVPVLAARGIVGAPG